MDTKDLRSCVIRLGIKDAEKVCDLAEKLDSTPSQVVHDLIDYALGRARVGLVTRPGLVFEEDGHDGRGHRETKGVDVDGGGA